MPGRVVEVECIFKTSTEKAVLVWEDESSKVDIWLPKSQIEIYGEQVRGNVITVVAPEDLFEEKGLI